MECRPCVGQDLELIRLVKCNDATCAFRATSFCDVEGAGMLISSVGMAMVALINFNRVLVI